MKTRIVVVAMMMVSTLMFAQSRHGNQQDRQEKRLEKMKSELSLTDDQYGKIKAIASEFASSRAAIRKDTSLTRGATFNKMKSLRADEEKQINEVLTKEQQAKWTELKAKREEERKKGMDGRHGEHKKKG